MSPNGTLITSGPPADKPGIFEPLIGLPEFFAPQVGPSEPFGRQVQSSRKRNPSDSVEMFWVLPPWNQSSTCLLCLQPGPSVETQADLQMSSAVPSGKLDSSVAPAERPGSSGPPTE